jgi:hypothetical protein
MSVCFSFQQLRFQRINARCVEGVALKRRVSTSRRKNLWSVFEQRINIRVCVKLGKHASDTCAVLFEAYGGEAMEKSSVSD